MSTIALCVICKNERENFPKFLASVEGCFDEIHITDTGSTDETVPFLRQYAESYPNVSIHHFQWVNDFSAARNHSFSHAKTDYIMWMDLDDILDNREAFLNWKASCMNTVDMWMATYHYGGVDAQGNSPCKFMRERVIKNNGNFEWQYFVHEGLMPKAPINAQYVTSWTIVHQRTEKDMAQDKSRNLKLYEGRTESLHPRMRYYYGKELFENGKPLEAYTELVKAVQAPELELHDRIMGIQYACFAAMQCNQFLEARHLAHQGLQLDPNRGEFFVIIADCLLKENKVAEAIPYFHGAKNCKRPEDNSHQAGAIFTHKDAYGHYPRNQLARCYFHTSRFDDARKAIDEALSLGPSLETAQIKSEIDRHTAQIELRAVETYEKVPEIAITCVPNVVKDWDERTLATRGLGGSETAVIHMANELHRITGYHVRVFNDRKEKWEGNGVSYESLQDMYEYFKTKLPFVHVAWRHNIRFSHAPMYLWCHDLAFLGLENGHQYDKILALSEFHKNWLTNLYGVPEDKVIITGNGINPKRFQQEEVEKNPKKIVFSSSPDRGLDRAIAAMDIVVKEVPDVELHVFYGMDLFAAMGKQAEAENYMRMMTDRPYVKYHGNVPQAKLTQEFESAAIWLYPTNFLETYCITAIESLCSGTYPIVRKFGALPDTLRIAEIAGMASVIDSEDPAIYAKEVIHAIKENFYQRVKVSPEVYSWGKIAEQWASFLPLHF